MDLMLYCRNGTFLLIVLFVQMMSIDKVSATPDKNRSDCQQNNRLIFDLSNVIRENPNTDKVSYKLNSSSACGGSPSSLFFHAANVNASKDSCWHELRVAYTLPIPFRGGKVSGSDCIYFGITGISIMFTERTTTADIYNLPVSPMTKDTITDLLSKQNSSLIDSITITIRDSDCRCTSSMERITDYLENKLMLFGKNKAIRNTNAAPPKLGLEYNERFLECCAGKQFNLLKFINHTVLKIDVNPLATLSYKLFWEMMSDLIVKNRNFVLETNPKCILYIHLVSNDKDSRASKASYRQYEFLISKYAQKWTEDDTGDEILIVRPSLKNGDISEESEHPTTISSREIGNQTGLPKNFTKDNSSSQTPEHGYNIYLVIVAVGAPLLIVILVLCFRMRRNESRFLEKKYVHQFYNGIQLEQVNGTVEESTNNYCPINIKFPDAFEICRKNLELLEVIGSGQFGVVRRGKLLPEQTQVAIKIPKEDCDIEQFKSMLAELKILCYIESHVNVVSFVGAYTKQICKGKVYIVTEFCEHGSLQGYLRNLQRRPSNGSDAFDLNRLCCFSHQIACGMEYVAGKRVIHGDLATRNVLLTGDYTCKIADFGLSRRLYEMQEYKKTSREPLPWRWMAPESLNNMEFTTMSDVWSYGITLWEIFSLGKLPYPGMSWTVHFVREIENGMRMEKAQHVSHDIYIKMLNCWHLDPKKRPNFSEMVNYFAELRDNVYLVLDE